MIFQAHRLFHVAGFAGHIRAATSGSQYHTHILKVHIAAQTGVVIAKTAHRFRVVGTFIRQIRFCLRPLLHAKPGKEIFNLGRIFMVHK